MTRPIQMSTFWGQKGSVCVALQFNIQLARSCITHNASQAFSSFTMKKRASVNYPKNIQINTHEQAQRKTSSPKAAYSPTISQTTWSMQTFFTQSKNDIATVCHEEKSEILPNQNKDGLTSGETCPGILGLLAEQHIPIPCQKTFSTSSACRLPVTSQHLPLAMPTCARQATTSASKCICKNFSSRPT